MSTRSPQPAHPALPTDVPTVPLSQEKASNNPSNGVRVPREVEKQKIVRELNVLIDRVRKL